MLISLFKCFARIAPAVIVLAFLPGLALAQKAMQFPDTDNVAPGTPASSAIVAVMDGKESFSVKKDIEFRVCADSTCGSVKADWSAKTREVEKGDFIQLRAVPQGLFGQTVYSEFAFGDAHDSWKIHLHEAAPCYGPKGILKSGELYKAWKTPNVPFGQECESETRQCFDGKLSGSFFYDSCTAEKDAACVEKPWGRIENMSAIVAFKDETVPYGEKCVSEPRVCENGKLSGTYAFNACTFAPPESCKTDLWGEVPHGETRVAYKYENPTMDQGHCDEGDNKKILTCNNGRFESDPEYKFKSCVNPVPAKCDSPCGPIGSGAGCMAFRKCGENEWRTCENGKLSGSYPFAESQCKSCELPWGDKITHGSTRVVFEEKETRTCHSHVVTCDDGKLKGSRFTEQSCISR